MCVSRIQSHRCFTRAKPHCRRLTRHVAQVRVYLRCYSPVTCCLAASDTPDGDRSWLAESAGAGALVVQSPLFVLQPGAPTVLTACLAHAPPSGDGAAPVAWVLRIWSRAEVQVRENSEPEDAIAKLISSFEDGNAGRSKEAEAARAAAVAAAAETMDADAAAAAVAEALALTDRKARNEALKKAASALPSQIAKVNAKEGAHAADTPVDAAHIQAVQEAAAVAVSENEAAAKAVADNRENLKPQLAKWAADLDGRATKTAASEIEKVTKNSLAQRNAFRQAAAVYASHLSAVEQSLAQVLAATAACVDGGRAGPHAFVAQVKLGRNAAAEEGGEETVSMANLELVQEMRAGAQEGGDWPAAVGKVRVLCAVAACAPDLVCDGV